ncbi:MAG: corrinoid protein [Oscillospiraceae bacterium]|jgi:corrinoid protein of di/trimethylamine methyltransferase|nr:corrinoid protein [Oscillospiraceae bacterium]
MGILQDISQALQRGRMPKVKELVALALSQGESPKSILEDGLLAGMSVIGEKFKNNEVFVPEVLVAARAMNAGTALLKEKLQEEGVTAKGKAVIGTVKGDLHDIGKNLVKLMLEGKGLEVIDLGVDVSPEKFVEAVNEQGARLVCCSALLTTTMGEMKSVVEALERAGVRDKVKILVGGAPITQGFCDAIGADAYAPDAASAADKALEYVTA